MPAPDDQSPLRAGPRGPFVFIHINKTAGTSIGRAIGIPRKLHLTAREIIDLVGEPAWADAYKFAFVRNPWDKVVSQYEFRVRTDKTGMGGGGVPFKEWVLRTIGEQPDPRYVDRPRLFIPQVEWLEDHSGQVDVQSIGRFEHLARDFARVCEDLGIAASLPHANRSPGRAHYREYYDDETAELVARRYRADLERFGYGF